MLHRHEEADQHVGHLTTGSLLYQRTVGQANEEHGAHGSGSTATASCAHHRPLLTVSPQPMIRMLGPNGERTDETGEPTLSVPVQERMMGPTSASEDVEAPSPVRKVSVSSRSSDL